jgi:hypothetical protein
MDAPQEKSKKPSSGNQTALKRLHDQYVFFLDENLCNCTPILEVLNAAEVKYERLLDHFPSGTDDVIWLPTVGQNGWVALTKDIAQRYNYLEKAAIINYKVRHFAFSSGNLNRDEMTKLLSNSLNGIFRFLEKHPPPFFASITQSGINLKSITPN